MKATQVMLTYHEEFIGLSPIAQDISVTDPDFEYGNSLPSRAYDLN